MDGKRIDFSQNTTLSIMARGCVAGLIGAIFMGFSASSYSDVVGGGWSTPMQAVAGTFYKAMAFVGGGGVTAIGSLTHLTTGMVFGVIFAFLVRKMRGTLKLVALGIFYSILVWAFMSWVTLPVLDWVMFPRVMLMGAFWFFLHWIYGAFMGLTVSALRGPDRDVPTEELAPPIVP